MKCNEKYIQQRIAELKDDRVHGASYLAQQAVDILATAFESINSDTHQSAIQDVVDQLCSIRPVMASIKNSVLSFVSRLDQNHKGRSQTRCIYETLVRHMEKIKEEATRKAALYIPPGGTVVTCSYSSTVIRTLTWAHNSGKHPLSLILGSDIHVQQIASELAALCIRAVATHESSIHEAVRKCTLALVGADMLLQSGAIINGTPTLLLAETCLSIGRPFYVVCDTFKLANEPNLETGFDLVPTELITGVFTEKGLYKLTKPTAHCTILSRDI